MELLKQLGFFEQAILKFKPEKQVSALYEPQL